MTVGCDSLRASYVKGKQRRDRIHVNIYIKVDGNCGSPAGNGIDVIIRRFDPGYERTWVGMRFTMYHVRYLR